jgi:hypothetical protein
MRIRVDDDLLGRWVLKWDSRYEFNMLKIRLYMACYPHTILAGLQISTIPESQLHDGCTPDARLQTRRYCNVEAVCGRFPHL